MSVKSCFLRSLNRDICRPNPIMINICQLFYYTFDSSNSMLKAVINVSFFFSHLLTVCCLWHNLKMLQSSPQSLFRVLAGLFPHNTKNMNLQCKTDCQIKFPKILMTAPKNPHICLKKHNLILFFFSINLLAFRHECRSRGSRGGLSNHLPQPLTI